MSMLHRQLLAQFMKEIEPIALRTLEGVATLAGPAAPVIDMALETADSMIRANNPDIGKPASPFPTATPAAPAQDAPAPTPYPTEPPPAPYPAPAPATAPVDPNAAVKAQIAAMQAQLSTLLASLS